MCQLGFATWIYEKQYDQFDNLRENSDLAHENITLIDEAGIYNHQSDSCVTGVPATVSNNSYKLIGDVVMHIFIKALGRHCFRWWLVYWKKKQKQPKPFSQPMLTHQHRGTVMFTLWQFDKHFQKHQSQIYIWK